jgi:hypothetical protein
LTAKDNRRIEKLNPYFLKELLNSLLFRQLTDAKGFVFYDILFIYIQMQMAGAYVGN